MESKYQIDFTMLDVLEMKMETTYVIMIYIKIDQSSKLLWNLLSDDRIHLCAIIKSWGIGFLILNMNITNKEQFISDLQLIDPS